nr:hypothetical protein CVCH_033 [Cavernulicola chilensis]
MNASFSLILSSIVSFLEIYLLLLLIRVSLSWFPNLNWYIQPYYSLKSMTDPYLKLFRGILPPFLGIDMSSMLALTLLQTFIQLLSNMKTY